jgi:hypothetical protein
VPLSVVQCVKICDTVVLGDPLSVAYTRVAASAHGSNCTHGPVAALKQCNVGSYLRDSLSRWCLPTTARFNDRMFDVVELLHSVDGAIEDVAAKMKSG